MKQKQALFSFQGRMRRRDYWIYSVPVLLLMLPSFLYQGGDDILDVVSLLLMLIVTYMSMALNIKRLKDRNKGPLWVLITLIPLVGPIFALVELGILEGTKGRNRYGPDPKRPESDTDPQDGALLKKNQDSFFEC